MVKISHFINNLFSKKMEKELIAIPQPINTTELLKGKVALITGGSGVISLHK